MSEEEKCENCVFDRAHSNLCDTCGDPISHFKADSVVSSCVNCSKLKQQRDDLLVACEGFMKFANKDIPKGVIIPKPWLNKLKEETHKIENAIAKAKDA